MAEMTRDMIVQLGITAMQAGITTPEELSRYITTGMLAGWRIPLAQRALSDVTVALRGLVDE